MTDYTWVGGTSPDASTAANWSPSSGIPNSTSDTAIFANDAACEWNIATVGTIQIKSIYTGMLIIASDIAITGLDIQVAGMIDTVAARILTFSGTPPYNSGKTHIVHGYSTDDSPFRTETARGYITYKMNGSSAITYDSGIYPHILLTNGSHTPDYAMVSGTRTNQIKFHSLTVNSGATFAPASATPSANDRLRKWISETAVATQFAISSGVASFNGGYAEWTFQAISSGFAIPTSGVATYNQCKFTFDKMIIDASVGGVGKWAQIIAPSRLILTDFTVNVGASVKGSSTSAGCAILLVNKPKIHGTWSFLPVADGYYVYPKTGETLGYPSGGTGLNALGSANQVLATNAGATAMEWQTVSSGSGDITGVTITTDSGGGSKAEDTGGSADFSILGATGVGVTNSGATITAVAVPGEIDHDSLQNFVAAEHVDWAGASAGTIHASNYTDTNTQLSNAEVVSAVEAESTLVLQSGVTIGTDLKLSTASDHAIIENVTQDKDVVFKVNDNGVTTEAMRIEGTSGFIGIGETNPDAPLHVTGSTNGTILKIESTSTDSMTPDIEFVNMTAPTAGDNLGNIEYIGKRESSVGADDLTTPVDYARIYAGIDGASGSTVDGTLAGKIGMQLFHQGARKTALLMEGHPTSGGMTTFNYNGEDMDFRVHGEDTSNLLYINGGSGYEGVCVGGVTTPKSMFTVDGTVTIKEQAAADGDSASYGQIWVKTATPNELYFTTDAGNDIPLTSGTNGPVLPGANVSGLNNDAGYLTAATTPTGTFCRWGDIGGDHTDNKATNILVDNWTYSEGSTALRDAMSSGVFTCTAALAGTYLIVSHLMYKTGTLGEADGRLFQIQNNLYYNAGGGTPSSGDLRGFTRHINNDKYSDTVIEGNYLLTLADGDTFGIYGKIGCSTSGTVTISSVNTFTNLHMVKIA